MFKTARRRSVAEMKKGILIVENSGAEGQEEGGKSQRRMTSPLKIAQR